MKNLENEDEFFAQYIGKDLYGNGYRTLISSEETPSGFTTVRTDTMPEMLEKYSDRKYSLTDSEFNRIPHEWKNIFSLGGSTITDFTISSNTDKSAYPEWIKNVVDSFNEDILESDYNKGKLLKVKTYTERQPREFSADKEKFDLIKRLLLEENILMEVEYDFRRINISYTKKV